MLLFLAFLIVIIGCVNWMLIGLLQYDFVAGLFGYQGSIFSRLIYIFVGICALFVVFKAFAGKGKLNLIDFKFRLKKKKDKTESSEPAFKEKQESNKIIDKEENSKQEAYKKSGDDYSEQDFLEKNKESIKNNIFDEL